MDKSPDAFRTISEVADHLDTPAHVLRFWESRFPQVRPVKRAGGRRYYRPSDVALLAGIRRLLHDEGLTIRGVQKILREQGVRHVAGLAEGAEAQGQGAEVIDLAAITEAVAAPAVLTLTGDTSLDAEDDDFADEWEDEAPEETAPEETAAEEVEAEEAEAEETTTAETGPKPPHEAQDEGAPPAPPEPPASAHDDLPLFAGTALPETQKAPLTGLRALRAAKPPVGAAPVAAAPAVPPPAPDTVTGTAEPAEIDLAAVLARLRALRSGALAPHREAIAGLTTRLEAFRATQGRPSRGSRG